MGTMWYIDESGWYLGGTPVVGYKTSLKRNPGPQCDVHAVCMDWAGDQWKLNGGYRRGCGIQED